MTAKAMDTLPDFKSMSAKDLVFVCAEIQNELKTRHKSLSLLIETVATEMKIDIKSDSRHRRIILVKQVLIDYVCTTYFGIYTLQEIANYFGYKDHTLIIHHRNKARFFARTNDTQYLHARDNIYEIIDRLK